MSSPPFSNYSALGAEGFYLSFKGDTTEMISLLASAEEVKLIAKALHRSLAFSPVALIEISR